MRVVSTRVLPVPAPASTSTGPSSVSTACALLGVEVVEIGPGARTHGARGNAARRRLRVALDRDVSLGFGHV